MFKATDVELVEKFESLNTNDDLASLLEIPKKSLLFFAYSKRSFYKSFSIPKKNGSSRTIYAPNKELKTLQRKILYILNIVYRPKRNVFGFVQHRNALKNAERHKGKREVLTIDLKDYFHQFHFGRVRGMLMSKPYSIGEEAATTLSNLLCVKITTPDGRRIAVLPQGAPTSPIITNMICRSLDYDMNVFAAKHALTYTRYADDIVLSSSDSRLSNRFVKYIGNDVFDLSDELKSVFNDNGLLINTTKTKIRKYYQRQMVTGIVINEQPNIKREYTREIRSVLFHCEKEGIYKTALEYANKHSIQVSSNRRVVEKWFRDVMVGRINYIGMVTEGHRGAYYDLASKANGVFGEELFDLSDMFKEADIIKNNLFIIENSEGTNQGTAFFVPSCGVFTCYHVLEKSKGTFYDSFSLYRERDYHPQLKTPTCKDIQFDTSRFPFDKTLDFALFRGLDSHFLHSKNLKIGNSDEIEIKDAVTIIGYPEYTRGTHTIIRSEVIRKGEIFDHPFYEIKDIVKHGFSGGLVLNTKKEVVGIVSNGVSSENLKSCDDFANAKFGFIPINCIMNYLTEIYDLKCD